MNTRRKSFTILVAAALLFLVAQRPSLAGSATWSSDPTSGDWNTPANWMPNTVPNSATDVATFAGSNVTALSISDTDVDLDSAVFNKGAPPCTLTDEGYTLTFSGAGIINDSGVMQSFVVTSPPLSFFPNIAFHDNASAGELTTFSTTNGNFGFSDSASAGSAIFNVTCGENGDGDCPGGSSISFASDTTAANAIINVSNYAAAHFNGGSGGHATFNVSGGSYLQLYNAYLDHATINCIGGTDAPYGESNAYVFGTTDAAEAAFNAIGGSTSGDKGGLIEFADHATANNATVVLNGGMGAGLSGTTLVFSGGSTAASASITANGGVDGSEGGVVTFGGHSGGGTASISLFGNGELDISETHLSGVTIGSVLGDGFVFLGTKTLTIGSNNQSTTFSGVIQDSGSLTKTGTGTLTLSGSNLHTGGTTVSAGTLVVSNKSGSGTGTGTVQVSAGTLGGSGIISGAVTVNSGAFLAPAHGTKTQSTLTIQSALTFNSGSTYTDTFKAKGKQAKTDKVIANGVTINSGANVTIQGTTKGSLKAGTAYTLISNTNANPISGTFSNLADGVIVNVNGNNLQASYEGGDGNDLTLTVVP